MKTLFIEAKKKIKDFDIDISNLPEKLHLLYSIQYKALAENIKKYLENNGYDILGFEQVLGCSKINPKAILLLIGSGKFHALQLAFSTSNPVFIYEGNSIREISQEEIDKAKNKIKAKLSKFYSEDNIGVLFSNKAGQKKNNNIIDKLRKKYDKNFYPFISNNIDLTDLDNFSINIWVNTACPGLEYDSNKVINYENIGKNK